MKPRSFIVAACLLAASLVPLQAARSDTMPACDAKRVIDRISLQYVANAMERPARIASFTVIRETGRGEPPAAANQYANDQVFIAQTRYCESEIVLDDNSTDMAYWVIHHFQDHGKDDFRPDLCSLKYDSWQDGCAQWRPAAATSPVVGAETCNQLLSAYDACIASRPTAEQAAMRKALDLLRGYLKGKGAFAGSSGPLAQECRQMLTDLNAQSGWKGCAL